jgi:hypothetical protein
VKTSDCVVRRVSVFRDIVMRGDRASGPGIRVDAISVSCAGLIRGGA